MKRRAEDEGRDEHDVKEEEEEVEGVDIVDEERRQDNGNTH